MESTIFHSNAKAGGWIASLFILGTSVGINIASGAWYSNLIIFLISEFNIKSIPAAQINNIFSGFINFFPLIAAIAADSSFGSFSVVLLSSVISLAGVIMFTFIAGVKSLRPTRCISSNSDICVSPSTFQYSMLYIALALASLGLGGTRFILGTMGADQFDKPKHQARFFNWFVFSLYIGSILGYTILIYIEVSVSWVLAYVIAIVANLIAVMLFLTGARIYRNIPSQGSPFTSIARVLVATIRKLKLKAPVDEDQQDCYYYESSESKVLHGSPSKSLRFMNRAARINRSNTQESGSQAKSWSLCTVEEMEDVKKMIKLMPLWSSTILLSTPIGVILSLTVLMSLVMDRNIGSHFKIPAGTFVVVTLIFTAITTSILDQFIFPLYTKITSRKLTHLQCIGIGHVSNILALIVFAQIERKRLNLVQIHNLATEENSIAPLSALWLVFPLAIMGIGEGFYFPADVALFYQEYPKKLRSTSTAMISLHIACGYYLSSAFIGLVGQVSSWLPNDINHGRVDMVFWVLLAVAGLNFGFFVVCAMLYKYNNEDLESDNETSISCA